MMLANAVPHAIEFTSLGLDPVAIDLGFFQIKWYSLAYLAGILIGYWYLTVLIRQPGAPMARRHADDFVFYATLGIIVGGRLGYVLFYNPEIFAHPLDVFKLWQGGMSLHGGTLGVIIAIWWMTRNAGLSFLRMCDYIACCVPFGLFFGRLANFVNGELWGRPSDAPWAIIFPRDPYHLPRHPSQLYEAALEGVALFVIMQIALRVFRAHRRPGLLSAIFFLGYGTFRFICEFFREPDTQFVGPVSMGMALSIPVWLGAGALFWLAYRKPLSKTT